VSFRLVRRRVKASARAAHRDRALSEPVCRSRSITGSGTFLGGVFHTLPFLIPDYQTAIVAAIVIVAAELLLLVWLRHRFFATSFVRSFVSVTLGRAIIASMSAALGVLAAG
jgi:erythrin-vacuolar iron transport family protein